MASATYLGGSLPSTAGNAKVAVLAAYCGASSTPENLPEKPEGSIRLVCQSDTHGRYESVLGPRALTAAAVDARSPPEDMPIVPPGDIYVHTGDFSMTGTLRQTQQFHDYVAALHPESFSAKIVIAGNHDITFDPTYYSRAGRKRFHFREVEDCSVVRAILSDSSQLTYLEDSGLEDVLGLSVWGSPWQPEFCDWAFNLERGPALAEKWSAIPDAVDLLLTHGPPAFFGGKLSNGDDAGCYDLWKRVRVVQPAVHVFGHVHEDYGVFVDTSRHAMKTVFANASSVTLAYAPRNPCVVLDLQLRDQSG